MIMVRENQAAEVLILSGWKLVDRGENNSTGYDRGPPKSAEKLEQSIHPYNGRDRRCSLPL